jgi:hypothetical protein
MTIGLHLLQIADAGLTLSNISVDDDIFIHLNILLDIEDILDQGRVSAAILNSGNEHTADINAKMDELRSNIRLLIDQCDADKFQAFMEARARRLQFQFSGPR